MPPSPGIVYLIGAGPGDPGLITVRGLGLLRGADVVLHDRLVSHDLLAAARIGAEIICVGKSPGGNHVSQERTNELLIRFAREGKNVVRLKGGDPFVFGRGFEEYRACVEAGVPCVVIPGVSSALAGPLAVGIPVTSRLDVRSVGIITGSFAEECQAPPLDYPALARLDTLIIMMGLSPLGQLADALMAAGRDRDTPAASVENATTPQQRTVRATLGTIAQAVSAAGLATPVVSVIGAVAAHARVTEIAGSQMNSAVDRNAGTPQSPFEIMGPLTGRRVVLTRPPSRARLLRRALIRAGAEVIDCPLIRIAFDVHAGTGPMRAECPSDYDWIAFTSANAVNGFVHHFLRKAKLDVRALAGVKVGAVGETTARALVRAGITADLTPDSTNALALAESILAYSDERPVRRVLFPCGDRALRALPDRLRAASVEVDEIVVYRTEFVTPSPDLLDRLRWGVDAYLFYSPSALSSFGGLDLSVSGSIAVCVGSTTAEAARQAGFERVAILKSQQPSSCTDELARILQSSLS